MAKFEFTSCSENGEFVGRLLEHNVDFIIIGGVAVSYHGCRDEDDVDDLDLMLRPSLENMERFIQAVASLNMTTPWSPQELAVPFLQLTLKTYQYLDILTPPRDIHYQDLSQNTEIMVLNGMAVQVISKQQLIVLKERSAKPETPNCEKHAKDLLCLRGA